MVFSIILVYILVSIFISLIFGLNVLSDMIISKSGRGKFLKKYLFQLWSLLFFLLIEFFFQPGFKIYETKELISWNTLVLFLLAIIPTSIIAYFGNATKPQEPFSVENFLSGAAMEIPQRLLFQNMFILLILNVNIIILEPSIIILAVLLNSLIWAQFIVVQEVINRKGISKKLIFAITSSICFSVCVGILYLVTGNIFVTMIAHGLQRLLTHWIRQKFGDLGLKKVVETQ